MIQAQKICVVNRKFEVDIFPPCEQAALALKEEHCEDKENWKEKNTKERKKERKRKGRKKTVLKALHG